MLKQRIMTAIVLFVVGVGFLFLLPQENIIGLAGLLLALMAWEWSGLVGFRKSLSKFLYVVVTLMIGWLAYLYIEPTPVTNMWQILTVGLTLGAIYGVLWFAKEGAWPVYVMPLLSLFGIFWLVNFAWTLTAVFHVLGVWWLLYAMSLVWIMDTGAYFTGKAIGKHKLAPLVSPGKTWEGVWGGVLLAVVFATTIALWQALSLVAMIVLAALVAGLSVVGDLFESAMKRQVGVKDSSQMLPGHGGWLDRFDALLLALPLFWLLWHWWLA